MRKVDSPKGEEAEETQDGSSDPGQVALPLWTSESNRKREATLGISNRGN